MHRIRLPFILVLLLLFASPCWAIPFAAALKDVDPAGRYLFYLHGSIMETEGKNAQSPRYGIYLYDKIIEHFEDRDLIVIEEVRGTVDPNKYASKITTQVRQLMAAGVPAANITVAGFSKGGFIALLVASSLNVSDVGYVIMAGCGRGQFAFSFNQFLKRKRGSRLQGRILSIYATSDMDAGSCQAAVDQASGKGLIFKETRIKSNKGHGIFYQPRPEWIEPTAIWAKGGR